MLYLLEQVHFLEDLTLAKFILHVLLLYCLDGHTFSSEFVHAQGYFTKGSLADELDEFVELKGSRRKLIILRNVILNIANELIPLLQQAFIYLKLRIDSAALARIYVSCGSGPAAG